MGITIKTGKYFLLAVLIKAIAFLIIAIAFNKAGGEEGINFIFQPSHDTRSYTEPAINLVDNGGCYETYGEKILYAHKMPGMVPIFVPLYYLFGYNTGLTILIILQFLTDALCCVLLGKIALSLYNSRLAFHLTFYGYSFSTIVSIYSHYTVSELFCTSFLIIASYYLIFNKNNMSFFMAGLFGTWSVFFRPTSILFFFIVFAVISLFKIRRMNLNNLNVTKTKVMLFFAPLFLFESIWIVRNIYVLNRFVPAEISYENYGTPALLSVYKVINAFGGDTQVWVPESEMLWFQQTSSINDTVHVKPNPFPAFIFSAGVTLKELESLRSKYSLYNDATINSDQRAVLEKEINLDSKTIIKKFKENAPFSYYLKAPLRTLGTFLIINRPYGFSFPQNGMMEKFIRLWHFTWYYAVLILYLFSFAWLHRRNELWMLVIKLFTLLHLLFIGFILRFTENRYHVPVNPFMLLLSTGTIMYFISRIKKVDFSIKKAGNI